MNIAFDASDLCTGREDGTTRYTYELLRRIVALGNNHTWHVLGPCHDVHNRFSLPDRSNVIWHPSPWPKYWTQTRMPFDLAHIKPDVLFMPIQQLPYIRPSHIKTVAVIHDLAIHRFGDQFSYKDLILLHMFGAMAIRQADALIAVSQATADDIARYHNRKHGVYVVHHGVDHNMFAPPKDDVQKQAAWATLTAAYPSLKKSYVLYTGQIQPRKNIVRLVKAFELAHKRQPQLQLVLAGGHGWQNGDIYKRIKKSASKNSIHVLGLVPDDMLVSLYWHATVFALPSLYEGFGMPILEAMASGCPVITSNTSSMKEIAGDAATLVDPYDVELIAGALQLGSNGRMSRGKRGREHAGRFSWDTCAKQTLDVIETTGELDI